MDKKTLRINQKIQIVCNDHNENDVWFDSEIHDVRINTICVKLPFLEERYLELDRGDHVSVQFSEESCRYTFNTRVVGKVANEELFMLDYPDKIYRNQQRGHVRVPVMLDVKYALWYPDKKKIKMVTFNKATAVDLSGGGMKLATREEVPEDTRLLLKFTLPLQKKSEAMNLEALVIRCKKADPYRELYHLGVNFEDINYREEDLIVRYVFEKMAQQKRLR